MINPFKKKNKAKICTSINVKLFDNGFRLLQLYKDDKLIDQFMIDQQNSIELEKILSKVNNIKITGTLGKSINPDKGDKLPPIEMASKDTQNKYKKN